MSKVTAPLLGFGASGQIGKTQVYGKWRGIAYARRHVVPANPRSAEQTKTRTGFTWLTQVWKLMSADAQAPWKLFSQGQPLTDRNAIIKANNSTLRTATDLSGFVASPGAKGGLACASFTATGGVASIASNIGAPALPTGWSIVEAVLLALAQQDPQSDMEYTSYSATDNSAPYTGAALTVPAGDYACFAWFKFQKPDGSFAFGPSSYHTATAT